MILNEAMAAFAADHPEHLPSMRNLFPVPYLEPWDISEAMFYLCSESGRYITGVALPLDAGFVNK